MNHSKSREQVLALNITPEVIQRLDELKAAWRLDAKSVPRGLVCSENKDGAFVLSAAESVFTTIPGACVIKGIGAIELIGSDPLFEAGASSKTLVLRDTAEGWRFSVKYVPPIIRARNMK